MCACVRVCECVCVCVCVTAQVIKCDLFDEALESLVKRYPPGGLLASAGGPGGPGQTGPMGVTAAG